MREGQTDGTRKREDRKEDSLKKIKRVVCVCVRARVREREMETVRKRVRRGERDRE
jgi:hypothetical protein